MSWPLWVCIRIHHLVVSDGQSEVHIWNLRASIGRGGCYKVYAIIVARYKHLVAIFVEEQENSSYSYKNLHNYELFWYAKSNRSYFTRVAGGMGQVFSTCLCVIRPPACPLQFMHGCKRQNEKWCVCVLEEARKGGWGVSPSTAKIIPPNGKIFLPRKKI